MTFSLINRVALQITVAPYAAEIAALQARTDSSGRRCLGTIKCGTVVLGSSDAEYNLSSGGNIVISESTTVTAAIIKHELVHADQCGGALCTGPFPTVDECKNKFCEEVAAYIRGDEGTGNACDKSSSTYDRDDCIKRAWNGSVLPNCPGCRRFQTGTLGSQVPSFPVTCPGL